MTHREGQPTPITHFYSSLATRIKIRYCEKPIERVEGDDDHQGALKADVEPAREEGVGFRLVGGVQPGGKEEVLVMSEGEGGGGGDERGKTEQLKRVDKGAGCHGIRWRWSGDWRTQS